jgi:hypothetical protein
MDRAPAVLRRAVGPAGSSDHPGGRHGETSARAPHCGRVDGVYGAGTSRVTAARPLRPPRGVAVSVRHNHPLGYS